MKKFLFLLVLIGSIWSGSVSYASDWVWLTSSDTVTTSIDVSSVRRNRNNDRAIVWVKYTNVDGTYDLVLYAFTKAHQIATLSTVSYNADGHVTDSYTVPEYRIEWRPIVPDTVGEGIYYYIWRY